jgi:predicted Zn-dependent peptidase
MHGSTLTTNQQTDNPAFRKSVLDNGLRVITETVPHVESVSIGIWVRTGSRFEPPNLNGVSHFIEHMLFKGTPRRTAYDIALEMDSVGGALNAFTSKEFTSYYCKVLHENMGLAVDLLTDIFLNSSFPSEEIEREKLVVCQEINQSLDNPEDLVHEELGMRFWKNDPLGQPILGIIPTVLGFDRQEMIDYKEANYGPERTVIAAAGKLDHDELVAMISDRMIDLKPRMENYGPGPGLRAVGSHVITKDLEQLHLCIGAQGPSAVDSARHTAFILNAIIGGGMSSRLFQEIREKRGLAYSVYSFLSAYSDTGMFGVYLGIDPKTMSEAMSLLAKGTIGLAETITEDEINTAKNQIKGNIILSLENTESRMSRLAKGEYYFGRIRSVDEVIRAIQDVTRDQLIQMAKSMLRTENFTCVAVGPIDEDTNLLAAL